MGPKLTEVYNLINTKYAEYEDAEIIPFETYWELAEAYVPTDNFVLLDLLNENTELLTYVFGQANLNGDADLGWVIWTCVREALMDEMFGTGNWEDTIYLY